VPLEIGASSATSIELSIATNVIGNFTANDIDSRTAVPLVIGKATATALTLADTGITSTFEGPVHCDENLFVNDGAAGAVTANANADELVVESSGAGGMSILAPDASASAIFFGSPSDNIGAYIEWHHNNSNFAIGPHKSGSTTKIKSGDNTTALTLDSSQNSTFAGTLFVNDGAAGAVTAHVNADEFVVESSAGEGGISILVPDASSANLFFGSVTDNVGSYIQWDYTSSAFALGSHKSGASTTIRSAEFVTGITLDSSQNTTLAGWLDRKKASVRAYNNGTQSIAVPVGPNFYGTTVSFGTEEYDANGDFSSNRFTNNSGVTKSYLVTFHTYQGVMAAGESFEFFCAPNIDPTTVSATTMHAYTDMIYHFFEWDSGLVRTDWSGVIRLASTEWFEVGIYFGGTGSQAIGSASSRADLMTSINIEEL
jgi:hypothetical protein